MVPAMDEQTRGMSVAEEPEASALEYAVIADLPDELPLDRIVVCERQMAGVGSIRYWGVIEAAAYGPLYYGLVRVIRIYPEVYVPPVPGSAVSYANPENVAWALRFSSMKRKFVIGQLPDEEGDPRRKVTAIRVLRAGRAVQQVLADDGDRRVLAGTRAGVVGASGRQDEGRQQREPPSPPEHVLSLSRIAARETPMVIRCVLADGELDLSELDRPDPSRAG